MSTIVILFQKIKIPLEIFILPSRLHLITLTLIQLFFHLNQISFSLFQFSLQIITIRIIIKDKLRNRTDLNRNGYISNMDKHQIMFLIQTGEISYHSFLNSNRILFNRRNIYIINRTIRRTTHDSTSLH